VASGLLPARPLTDRVPDSVLDELAADLVAQRGLTGVETIVAADFPSAVVSDQPIPADTAPEQEGSQPPAGSPAGLMDLVLAAGLCGSVPRSRRSEIGWPGTGAARRGSHGANLHAVRGGSRP
jgi:hypothetical protein